MTLADKLFERFCSRVRIRYEPIPTGTRKSPDYRISIGGQLIIAEVKQLDPNEKERADIAQFEQGQSGGYSTVPGDRVRRELSKANAQLSVLAKGRYPAIVVIYNNVFLRFHTDPYNVRVAMYGVEQVLFAVPSDPKMRAQHLGVKFGPKRKMTREHNTTISAVGVLVQNPPGDMQSPHLVIYHNVFARIPLSAELLRPFGIDQFTLAEPVTGKAQAWVAA